MNLTSMWVNFFNAAGIPSDVSATYAITFAENRIQNDMLLDLNKEYLRDMGIVKMGDVIAILKHAKQVHESAARDRVLNTSVARVPVAAVTGRTTSAQPSSPASRILEHYTRNAPVKEPSPVKAQKRKSDEVGHVPAIADSKKSRLIRFGPSSSSKTIVKEAAPIKQTVFARLGSTESPAVVAKPNVGFTKTINILKPDSKPIFARLGSKSAEQERILPIPKDALKYEGILKGNPVRKMVTVTSSQNNVRKIACTMRADETPMTVKEKLALPTGSSKTVKFSNKVHYKEIEANKLPVAGDLRPKVTSMFNKPERRLSMPEGSNVSSNIKGRLGIKKSTNVTITKNIFRNV